jgi:hypothetical protein
MQEVAAKTQWEPLPELQPEKKKEKAKKEFFF